MKRVVLSSAGLDVPGKIPIMVGPGLYRKTKNRLEPLLYT